jgi:hypothetical protein
LSRPARSPANAAATRSVLVSVNLTSNQRNGAAPGKARPTMTEQEHPVMTTNPTTVKPTYCARIVFYSREGWNLQDAPFTSHKKAEAAFAAIKLGSATDLPPNWYAARLERFDGLLSVNFRIQDTILRDELPAIAWPECRKCGKLIGSATATRYGTEWEHMECHA